MTYSFTIRKRKRDNYQLILSYKGKDKKWHQKAKGGFKKARLANDDEEKSKLLDTVKALMAIDPSHEDITLNDFLDIYADDRKIRAATKSVYHCALEAFGEIADMPMKDITLAQIKGILANSEHKISTKNIRITTIKTLFKSAYEEYAFLPSNPMARLRRYPQNQKINPHKILSDADVDKLLSADSNIPEYPVVCAIGALAGLRIGEILGLSLSDIDFKKHTISVSRQFNSSTCSISALKTGNSLRVVPIPPRLEAILSNFIASRKVISMDGRLFKKVWPSHFRKWMKTIVNTSPHALRHTYITNLVAHGMDVKTVSALAGDTPATILEHYVHYTDKMREQAAKDVVKIFG